MPFQLLHRTFHFQKPCFKRYTCLKYTEGKKRIKSVFPLVSNPYSLSSIYGVMQIIGRGEPERGPGSIMAMCTLDYDQMHTCLNSKCLKTSNIFLALYKLKPSHYMPRSNTLTEHPHMRQPMVYMHS